MSYTIALMYGPHNHQRFDHHELPDLISINDELYRNRRTKEWGGGWVFDRRGKTPDNFDGTRVLFKPIADDPFQ